MYIEPHDMRKNMLSVRGGWAEKKKKKKKKKQQTKKNT